MGTMTDQVANTSEAHHYVPKFYLKGFTDEHKTLWVYEKGRPPRRSRPKDEAHRENYYTYDDKGYPDSSIEKVLSQSESVVAPIFKKIANPQFRMTNTQAGNLLAFVAMTFVRVPAYRSYIDRTMEQIMKNVSQQHAQDREKFYADCKQMELQSGSSIGDYEELRQFVLGGEYSVHQRSAGYNMKMTFESCETIMDILLNEYRHDVWYAPKDSSFLTSDNPVLTICPTLRGTAYIGVGFKWQDTEVVFPLNKRACLILARRCHEERVEVSHRRVNQINDLMMGVAQQYVYASVGYRRISRLFDERGCKIKYGENAFVSRLTTGV